MGRRSRPAFAIATVLATALVIGSCGPCEQSSEGKGEDARETVADFLSAVRTRNFEEACSLLALPFVDGSPSPRERPGWPAACRDRHMPKRAKVLDSARVGVATDLSEFNQWWDFFPLNQLIPAEEGADVDTLGITISNAPGAKFPKIFLSNYEGIDGGGDCGREWCITLTPLGPIGRP